MGGREPRASHTLNHQGDAAISEAKEVIIVSSDEVAGRRITSVLGLVRGNSVRARNLVRDVQALARTVVGGRIGA